MLQALLAGNAAVVKPAPGCEAVTAKLLDAFCEAGVPRDLVIGCGPENSVVDEALQRKVDCVVLTASSQTGRIIARKAAERLIPVIAELSGSDAVVVLPGADLDRVAAAVAFGLRLNGSNTCMAPRRLVTDDKTLELLMPRLLDAVGKLPAMHCRRSAVVGLEAMLQEATAEGATVVQGAVDTVGLGTASPLNSETGGGRTEVLKADAELVRRDLRFAESLEVVGCRPIILGNIQTGMRVSRADIFAPVLSILTEAAAELPAESLAARSREDLSAEPDVAEWLERLRAVVDDCPYALTVSVFGPEALAVALASKVNAGVVTVNDLIAPTVEPSISFGGRGESGYGATRGSEGLRQLTREKSIVCRRGNFLPHLRPPEPTADGLLEGLLRWQFSATWRNRLAGLQKMIRAGKNSGRDRSGFGGIEGVAQGRPSVDEPSAIDRRATVNKNRTRQYDSAG